jgi:hypothetical protein
MPSARPSPLAILVCAGVAAPAVASAASGVAADPRRDALSRGATLLIVLSLLTVVLLTGVVLLRSLRRTRRARERAERKRGRPLRTDAWAEAGRRAGPIDVDPDLPDDADRLERTG